VEKSLGQFIPWPHSPTLFLASVLDWQRTGWVYRASGVSLLQSFWARFGWGHVGLPQGWYWGLGVVTILGAIGLLVGLVRLWRSNHSLSVKRAVGLLAVVGLFVWGSTISRPHPVLLSQGNMVFIPIARYAFPAIIPTALALMGGWLALVPQRARRQAAIGVVAGLALLDMVSLVTIILFYHGR